jgi:hypothetical protein
MSAQNTLSEARADAAAREACDIINATQALSGLCGWVDGDTVPAIQVRWFCNRLREHAEKINVALDPCEPEPEARP